MISPVQPNRSRLSRGNDDEIGEAFLQALVKRRQGGASLCLRAAQDEGVRKVAASREVPGRATDADRVLEDEVGSVKQRFEGADQLLTVELINALEHPDEFGQSHVTDEEVRRPIREQSEHCALLRAFVARDEPDKKIGVESDHARRRTRRGEAPVLRR